MSACLAGTCVTRVSRLAGSHSGRDDASLFSGTRSAAMDDRVQCRLPRLETPSDPRQQPVAAVSTAASALLARLVFCREVSSISNSAFRPSDIRSVTCPKPVTPGGSSRSLASGTDPPHFTDPGVPARSNDPNDVIGNTIDRHESQLGCRRVSPKLVAGRNPWPCLRGGILRQRRPRCCVAAGFGETCRRPAARAVVTAHSDEVLT